MPFLPRLSVCLLVTHETRLTKSLQEVREKSQHCLYQRFQQTAAALTQVYQGQVEEGRDWQPFQVRAGGGWEEEAAGGGVGAGVLEQDE